MVPVPTNFRPNWCVCIIPMLLLVLLVPFLLYLLPQLSSEPVTTTMAPMPIPAPAPPMPTRPPYVPPAPRPPAPAPRPPPAPPAPPADPNCAVGSPMQWQQNKKQWCCTHHHIGCPPTPPPAPIFRPPPPPPVVQPIQPPPAPIAPPVVQPVTTSCPYDCNAGFSNWAKGWPIGKKQYCCRTANKGCEGPPPAPPGPVGTTSLPYDCNAGYHDCYHCLLKQWSVGKLAWCCQHMQRGCPTTLAPR